MSEGYYGERNRPYEDGYATAADVMREMRENDVEEDEFGDGMGVETDGVRDDFSELPLLLSSWSSPEATCEAIHDDITIMKFAARGFCRKPPSTARWNSCNKQRLIQRAASCRVLR